MKALFSSYFNVSIVSAVLVLLVFAIRLILRKSSKTTLVILWMLVLLRLVIPVQLFSPISIRPELPILQKESTSFIGESELVKKSEIPEFMPHMKGYSGIGESYVRVDYVEICSYIWLLGILLFAIYFLFSFIRLKIRMREAVRLEENVYETPLPNTAFLLGYVRPKIYIPSGLSETNRSVMILHEKTHSRLGHNWLKLAWFVVAALHWYNPFVWLAYVLFCEDIEYACDEAVILNMSGEEKKQYCATLLNCGRTRTAIMSCPVAFGESNIRGRIKRVLDYKKPSVWIGAVAAVIVVVFAVFLVTDPAPKYPEHYKELISLVGQPKEMVITELGITLGDEVAPNTGIYTAQLETQYEGINFELELGFSTVDDRLWCFRYIALYENDRQTAAEDTVKITKRLIRSYGTAEQKINKRTLLLSEIDVPSVLDKFENKWLEHEGIDNVSGHWDLTDQIGKGTLEYWETLKDSEFWEKMWQDRNVNPNFGLTLSAWCDPDKNTCCLILDYDTGYEFQPSYEIIE